MNYRIIDGAKCYKYFAIIVILFAVTSTVSSQVGNDR